MHQKRITGFLVPGIFILCLALGNCGDKQKKSSAVADRDPSGNVTAWIAPDTAAIPKNAAGVLIRYGRALIANTAFYFGPKGKIAHSSNGMNCQNCHLDAGTKPWGNNFSAVFSTYPKFRERRGSMEDVYQRINDCFQRSLDGQPLDSAGHEMQAMLAYMQWLDQGVAKSVKPAGSGLEQLPFPGHAADPIRGQHAYEKLCVTCHGQSGEGKLNADAISYLYPPLWGSHSYNTGAGLYRLSRFAGYIKDNMPFGVSHKTATLGDEEAWDIAAFVNSQPRPDIRFKNDWPDISLKPVDHPFGPYADSFSEQQHKYGPFGPIRKMHEHKAIK